MKYPSIRIEGAIVASDILEKIEGGEITGQRPVDFKIEGNYKVKDEIARAWADAKDYWRIFKRKRDELAADDRKTGTSETRSQWMIPFLGILGYKAEFARAEEVNGKSYAISHRDRSMDKFPIHIMGFKDELDKKRKDSGPRMSPHALLQEYLNLTEHLYAIVTNGLQIRLLRDSSRLIKLSYIEFDLERMMEDELYADFAILYRLLHFTRMPINQETVAESLLEVYHQDSLESGSRIRDGLSEAVKNSILAFSNGFLSHPANDELRNWFEEGDQVEKQKQFFQWQLRLIYRLLFLMVIEERDLIYPKGADKKLKSYYYDFYSLNKLRSLSEKRHLADPRYSDYWQSVRNTFRLFENEKYGKPLGIAPLSGLFEFQQIGLLNKSTLDNSVLLECLRNLSMFKNKNNNQVMRVNYASLNVEEFGSVYEGLLEYDGHVEKQMGKWIFKLVKSNERSSSGSHYTPDELVQPLIKHSLDYIIDDKLKEENPEEALLSITVCDVACGSGHILLNAARRIATQLAIIRTGEEQPSPTEIRQATRDAIRHCIYGVDLNPLAVELCKVALWLEAHNPNEPLNFLDHRIKCGNAIVGLAHREELENGIADEAFKTLPGDDKDIAKAFLTRNKAERKERKAKETQLRAAFEEKTENTVQEAMAEYEVFKKMPESSPEEITVKQKAYNKFLDGKGYMFLKAMCDTQVAQFFIPKTNENKDRLITDNDFRQMIQGYRGWTGPKAAKAVAIGIEKTFFHWFLEFPHVFSAGGFDIILGNPPYLGSQKLSGKFGARFTEYLKSKYNPIGIVDLVAYFFRRTYQLLNNNGFQSLLSTDTIGQGKLRVEGLQYLVDNGATINHAVRSMIWPGDAKTKVALVTICKYKKNLPLVLDNRVVEKITTYLDDSELSLNPLALYENSDKSFIGSMLNGDGFILTKAERDALVSINGQYNQVIFPYLNGRDLNSSPSQEPSRWVVNFFNWSEEKAKRFIDVYKIIFERVRPFRQRWKKDKEGNEVIGEHQLSQALVNNWWIYEKNRLKLYSAINSFNRVLVRTQASKHNCFAFSKNDKTFDQKLVVFCHNTYSDFAFLTSSIHENWLWKYKSDLGDTPNYSPSAIYQTYPFPPRNMIEETIGEGYYNLRQELMEKTKVGLTFLYNQYHNNKLILHIEQLNTDSFKKNFGKETWNLYNHLEVKNEGNISYEEAVPLIFKLRELHKEMDEAVLAAYGWEDIQLRHDFYEVDYLPENDRVRYTIHPDARKEVLKRLLLLNHERYEEEVKQGLHKKKDVVAFYQQKGKELPGDAKFSDGAKRPKKKELRPKTSVNIAAEPESPYKQTSLFEEPNLFRQQKHTIQERSKVIIKNQEGKEFKYHLLKIIEKGSFTGEFKDIATNSKLAMAMIGKKEGDGFEFGGGEYVMERVM